MKKLNIDALQTALEKAKSLQKNREDGFSDKSEEWQASKDGIAFRIRTEELELALLELDHAIGRLDNWNNEV